MTWLNNWLMERIPSYKLAIKNADPRTKDWFLVWADPIPMLTLVLIYLTIVILGPRYMKHREAIHVPAWILFTYNIALVILSAYMVEEVRLKLKRNFSSEFIRLFRLLWVFIVVDIISSVNE